MPSKAEDILKGFKVNWMNLRDADTGKSLSEALPFEEHGENMLCTTIVLNVKNNF